MPDPGASHAYTRLGRFALIVTTLLWGSSFTIMKDALATVPTLWLLAIRFSGAAMLMALIGIRSLRRLDRGYLTGGACMGVCLYLAYTIQTYGLVHTTPGKNAFLAATYCVFVPFFWWLIHKRRPDRYNLAAALLCLCGMGLVSLQSDLRIGRGEGLTILSGVFYALHIIATARVQPGAALVRAVCCGSRAQLGHGAVRRACAGGDPGGCVAASWLPVRHVHRPVLPAPDIRAEVHPAHDGGAAAHARERVRHAVFRCVLSRASGAARDRRLRADPRCHPHLGDEAEVSAPQDGIKNPLVDPSGFF